MLKFKEEIMKKNYTEPKIERVGMEIKDVITSSGSGNKLPEVENPF